MWHFTSGYCFETPLFFSFSTINKSISLSSASKVFYSKSFYLYQIKVSMFNPLLIFVPVLPGPPNIYRESSRVTLTKNRILSEGKHWQDWQKKSRNDLRYCHNLDPSTSTLELFYNR